MGNWFYSEPNLSIDERQFVAQKRLEYLEKNNVNKEQNKKLNKKMIVNKNDDKNDDKKHDQYIKDLLS